MTIGTDILTKKSSNIETFRIPEDGSFQNKRDEELGDVLEVDFDQNIEAIHHFLGEKSVAQKEEQ